MHVAHQPVRFVIKVLKHQQSRSTTNSRPALYLYQRAASIAPRFMAAQASAAANPGAEAQTNKMRAVRNGAVARCRAMVSSPPWPVAPALH